MLGKNANVIAEVPCLRQKNKATLSAATRGVVEVARHASVLHKLGMIQTDGSNCGSECGCRRGSTMCGQETKLL
jgi:hypothetical protein